MKAVLLPLIVVVIVISGCASRDNDWEANYSDLPTNVTVTVPLSRLFNASPIQIPDVRTEALDGCGAAVFKKVQIYVILTGTIEDINRSMLSLYFDGQEDVSTFINFTGEENVTFEVSGGKSLDCPPFEASELRQKVIGVDAGKLRHEQHPDCHSSQFIVRHRARQRGVC